MRRLRMPLLGSFELIRTRHTDLSTEKRCIKGMKCPLIKIEEASVPNDKSVDEDVAIKPGVTGDETSDASASKKSKQGDPSGQTTN